MQARRSTAAAGSGRSSQGSEESLPRQLGRALTAFSLAEGAVRKAQQKLKARRKDLEAGLDRVDVLSATRQQNTQLLASAATAVREVLQTTPTMAPLAESSIARNSGAGGRLVSELQTVHARLEAADAELKVEAELHNEDRCLALRVMGIEGVRVAILGEISLRHLGGGRRVCKDWHRWNSQVRVEVCMRQNPIAIRYQFCADQELMHGAACRHYSCESQLFHCAFALAIC